LLIAGQSNFSFERIPIPVDHRVKTFTARIGVAVRDDEDVRTFWSRVLEGLRRNLPINMIHLDSLVWQIGTLNRPAIVNYFAKFDLKNVGEKLGEMVRE
jgi:DNA-(apurinic or apyrimidinic site) lyase